MKTYDIVVIGGGPGGYVAAIRASKEGKKVALVEQGHLGGTCLNRGCIPSKALLKHAEVIHTIRDASKYGVEVGDMTFSLSKMMDRKNQVINTLRGGIQALLRGGKIDLYEGKGSVQPDKTVKVIGEKEETIQGTSIIVATGSFPTIPPIEGLDKISYLTSDDVFDITEIPESIAIIGGGVIGVEFASIFESLGTNVTIVEMADRIVPSEDPAASQLLTKTLRKNKITILTSTKVTAFKEEADKKIVVIQDEMGANKELAVSAVLVAIGRSPNHSATEALTLQKDGKFIKVNEKLETSQSGIYAIGDVIGNWQLAHVASAEGMVAAQNAAGLNKIMDYRIVPRCIYTSPEIASVGLTEAQAKEQGYQVKTATYQLAVNGKALASDHREGFVKIIADKEYGEILGALLVGPHVTDMISQISSYMQLEGTVEEMAELIFPHPTISETLMEAANDWLGKGIHS
ncbi:dihydrolipoyl dehydrogenase [Brevibacillus daliensis]|uniref:dihydrolipoyl dehydrogenase n=1 Tax=Brevibacillus daliensis TaxID=2892995 RepID=UPI001E29B954|nr:dihydrolipoyl dehydrogenase [Brevibacillus daliensis]